MGGLCNRGCSKWKWHSLDGVRRNLPKIEQLDVGTPKVEVPPAVGPGLSMKSPTEGVAKSAVERGFAQRMGSFDVFGATLFTTPSVLEMLESAYLRPEGTRKTGECGKAAGVQSPGYALPHACVPEAPAHGSADDIRGRHRPPTT